MKKNHPLISVIIPCFNSETFIERCICSVLVQDFQNYEIIILDNNSHDSTLDLLKNFLDDRIRIFSEVDFGTYDAMNKGIKLAKGEWVYFLGSDDYLYNNQVFFNVWSIIKNTKHSVVYGNVLIKGNPGWAKDGEVYAGEFSKNRMLVKAICHQAIFYRTDFLVLNSLLFDLNYPVSADWHFNLRCRRFTNFQYVNMIVAIFQAGGISTLKSDNFRDRIRIEFSDLYPSKAELILKRFIKKIIFYAKKTFKKN